MNPRPDTSFRCGGVLILRLLTYAVFLDVVYLVLHLYQKRLETHMKSPSLLVHQFLHRQEYASRYGSAESLTEATVGPIVQRFDSVMNYARTLHPIAQARLFGELDDALQGRDGGVEMRIVVFCAWLELSFLSDIDRSSLHAILAKLTEMSPELQDVAGKPEDHYATHRRIRDQNRHADQPTYTE